jgi:hypothetical protein
MEISKSEHPCHWLIISTWYSAIEHDGVLTVRPSRQLAHDLKGEGKSFISLPIV